MCDTHGGNLHVFSPEASAVECYCFRTTRALLWEVHVIELVTVTTPASHCLSYVSTHVQQGGHDALNFSSVLMVFAIKCVQLFRCLNLTNNFIRPLWGTWQSGTDSTNAWAVRVVNCFLDFCNNRRMRQPEQNSSVLVACIPVLNAPQNKRPPAKPKKSTTPKCCFTWCRESFPKRFK